MPPMIALIALNLPVVQPFDYLAGDLSAAHIGCRVRVPFGQKERIGIVVGMREASDRPLAQLKAVTALLDEQTLLPHDMLALLRFCSDYYHYPLGPTLFAALPGHLRKGKEAVVRTHLQWKLTPSGMQQGAGLPVRAKAQRALFARLCEGPLAENALEVTAHARNLLKTWLVAAWIETAPSAPLDILTKLPLSSAPVLNFAQQQAVEQVQAALGRYETFLLHGVTGSGKTEVYLHLAQQVIAQGGQVLLLVPEIHLTPQLTGQFSQRFGAELIATLHSGLGETQRLRHWLAAQNGTAKIVLGTRLALFTPMPALQLIVVDEEHDSGFHQQEGLRYAARDMAVVRAQRAHIPIVLGSATPSLESWHNALTGRYQRITLAQRATSITMPTVRLIDSRANKPIEGLTTILDAALQQNLARGQQSLVFANRRGYAPSLYCRDCGWAAGCPRCSAKLVLHLREKSLRCHHCGYQQAMALACPNCEGKDLHPGGVATQRLEQHLCHRFPTARILRVDRDSTQGETRWLTMQQAIRNGEIDILVGTQLLSKGHDFPGLSLVGIIGADDALYSTDFRATERLFAQLMQVGGRAGRAQWPGEVLIQTRFPDHPLYQALQQHNYAEYAEILLDERNTARLPPYFHLAALRADAPALIDALVFLQTAQQHAPQLEGVTLFDPTPDAMPRKANRDRALLLVQSAHRGLLQHYLSLWMPALYALRTKNIRWHLDVDPQQV